MEPVSEEQLASAHQILSNRARALARCHATADDLVQEVLLRVLTGSSKYDAARGSWVNFLHVTLTDVWSRHCRTRARRIGREQRVARDKIAVAAEDSEYRVRFAELQDRLRRVLPEFAPRERQVLPLYLMGHNVLEICRQLQLSTANTWQLMHRCRKRLRQLLAHDVDLARHLDHLAVNGTNAESGRVRRGRPRS